MKKTLAIPAHLQGDNLTTEQLAELENYGDFDMSAGEISARQAEETASIAVALPALLAGYRSKVAVGEITYNGVKAENTKESVAALNQISNYLLVKNDGAQSVDWKGPDGWHTASIKDVQGLIVAAGELTQNAFSAERAVLETHAQTPYADFNAMKAAFDALMEG